MTAYANLLVLLVVISCFFVSCGDHCLATIRVSNANVHFCSSIQKSIPMEKRPNSDAEQNVDRKRVRLSMDVEGTASSSAACKSSGAVPHRAC
jgi:hypothetical protein